MAETLSGMVERVTFHSEETGYAVLRVKPEGQAGAATLVGRAPAVTAGEMFHAEGEWVDAPEYGRQFRATEVRLSAPRSLEGIEKYLGSGLIDGIGPSYAKRLVERFGEGIFSVIENESRRLEDVPGIGEKRRKVIRESWMKQKATHGIMVFLFQHGLGTGRARRILKQYGEEAVERIRSDPYRLAEDIDGIGFLTADAMARQMGVDREAVSRLRAGLLHEMERAGVAGHTAVRREELQASAAELLGCGRELLEGPLGGLIRERTLVEEEMGGERLIFTLGLREAEKVIAACLRSMRTAAPLRGEGTAENLSEGQRRAVELALEHRLLIITGGPGVGKTTVTRALLDEFAKSDLKVVLAAPTGRAARRLEESSGRTASTIHRLLEFDPEKGFKRWSGRPLEGDVFLLDEASMIDTLLMAHFVRALPPEARLILVGDADQLPSVGAGRVLRDLIESGLMPVAELTEIFRQAGESEIVQAAHAVNRGLLPELSRRANLDFYFIERGPTDTLRTLVDLVARRIPAALKLDPLTEVQTLTPMNRRSLGAQEINRALQAALNPGRPDLAEIPKGDGVLRTGDRVMQVRNDYEKEVFNGDLGRVVEIQAHPLVVAVRFDDGRSAAYDASDLDDIVPAHAITIHKSQGSEFPAVVIPVVKAHHIMLRRNLIYTAITRGKRFVVMVGDRDALAAAVRRTDGDERLTGLKHWLRG